MEHEPHQDLQRRQENRPAPRRRGGHGSDFFGLDIESMSPEAQVCVGLVVILPVVLTGAALFALTDVWLYFALVFGWTLFPASGALIRGVSGLVVDKGNLRSGEGKERELLEALREHGELTPTRAALKTSLTVSEADEMLKGLVESGYLGTSA